MYSSNLVGQLILILFLTLLNAFLSASEIAIVSVNKQKIRVRAEDGDKKAIMLLDILKEPSRFFSTLQVGITFAGFLSSASAAVGISNDLGKLLNSIGVPFGRNIAFIGVTLILSYIMLVFGELVPKRIALQNAEKFAMVAIKPINLLEKLIKPFVTFLSFSTNVLVKLFGFKTTVEEEKVTIEEISSLIRAGQEHGVIDPVMRERIDSVISFNDKVAEEIMTARTNVFMMDIDNPINPSYDNSDKLLRHSRIPIYKDTIDNIIGILYLKDYLLQAYELGFENINIEKIMRPAYFVSQRKSINELFLELQKTQNQFAVLINEYGGFPGIVTMEDIVEEIIGDVYDEYDHDEPDIKKIDKNVYSAKGSISIKELNSKSNLKLNEDAEHYDTLGGLLIYLLGYIPKEGKENIIKFENIEFKIEKIRKTKIKTVRITKLEEYD